MQNHAIPCKAMPYHAIPCNIMQFHAISCNTMQYNVIQCNTMQHHAIPRNTMLYHAIPCNTMQYHAIPCNTMKYHVIPCKTIKYHTIPHNTIQYHAIPFHTNQYHTGALSCSREARCRCLVSAPGITEETRRRWAMPSGKKALLDCFHDTSSGLQSKKDSVTLTVLTVTETRRRWERWKKKCFVFCQDFVSKFQEPLLLWICTFDSQVFTEMVGQNKFIARWKS